VTSILIIYPQSKFAMHELIHDNEKQYVLLLTYCRSANAYFVILEICFLRILLFEMFCFDLFRACVIVFCNVFPLDV